MQLIKIEENQVRLNSRLTEVSFGKTNFASIISQKGVLAQCTGCKDGNYSFSFSDWHFEDVKALDVDDRDDRVVFYCGSAEGFSKNAKTLGQLMADENKETAFEAGYLICSVLTQAAAENIDLPLNGGGGILIELNKENSRLLFLPAELYKNSVGGLVSQDYAELFGSWVNQTITGLPAICFFRGVVAYKMLTGRFAYSSIDPTERNADILDRKFLPLELSINGVNKTLAREINKALKLNSSAVNIPGKKKKGKASEDLTPTATFPLDLLIEAKNASYTNKESDEEFELKAQNYLKNQAAKVQAKRNLRRNVPGIIGGLIALVIIAIVAGNWIKGRREEFTSKGLTSEQTIQAFLYGVNEKDSLLLGNVSKGREAKNVTDSISRIYVLSKQRQAYTNDNGYGTMVSWLFYSTDAKAMSDAGLYCVALPVIDGKSYKIINPCYMIKDKPEALTVQNGVTLKDKDKSVHKAEYYLLQTDGEEGDIQCEYITDYYTLEYQKDRWYITKIETTSQMLDFDSNAFKNEYLEALSNNDGDIIAAANELRFRYPWVSPEEDLLKEKERREILAKNPFAGI